MADTRTIWLDATVQKVVASLLGILLAGLGWGGIRWMTAVDSALAQLKTQDTVTLGEQGAVRERLRAVETKLEVVGENVKDLKDDVKDIKDLLMDEKKEKR